MSSHSPIITHATRPFASLPVQFRAVAALVFLLLFLTAGETQAQGRRRSVGVGGPAAPHAPEAASFDLIDRAVSEGRISADQGMLYKVFAIYDDPRLPSEMSGDDSAASDTLFMTEVAARYATLPVEVQQQVAPFLIPPFHQHSWWQLRQQQAQSPYTQATVSSYGFGIDRPCTDCPLSFDWKFVATANGKVKIWYYGSNLVDELKAKGFANEIDQVIWPKLKALMGREPLPDEGDGWLGAAMGGDSRLDIALVDIGRSVTTAFYPDGCAGAAWASIQFNSAKPREELAHELMHAFQYAFNVKVRGGDCTAETEYRWLMESTAEWVKDAVYPGSTSPHNEHWAAKHFLVDPEKPLNVRQDPHWYGAYLLPFFLARMKGQPALVGQMWANTESHASLQAVENALQPLGGFKKVWPEFVLHNWNDDPVDDYRKSDQLASRAQSYGDTLLQGGAVDLYADLQVRLPHLSSTYRHFVLNDNVNSFAFLNGLTFRFSTEPRMFLNTFDLGHQYKWEPLPADQTKNASVQAILKKNGKWQEPEDWTNIAYKPFCRQKPDERIEEIVLIFANSSIDESSVLQAQGQPPLLIVTDMGCRFEGTLDWDSGDVPRAGSGDLDLQYHNRWEPRDAMEPIQHFLGYFYDTIGHANWNVSGTVGPCSVGKQVMNAPIRTDLATFSMNFAPKGSKGYRKGYYQLHMTEPVRYEMHCPTGDIPLELTFIFFPAVSFDPLMYISNVPGGGLRDKVTNALGTWEWDFKPAK